MGQIYHTYFISKAKTDCESVCYQFLCPLPGCNMQAPSLTNMQMHHESKHPKIPWDPSIYTDLQAFPAPLSLTPSPSLPLSPHLPPPSPPRSPSSPGTLEFTPTCWHSFPPSPPPRHLVFVSRRRPWHCSCTRLFFFGASLTRVHSQRHVCPTGVSLAKSVRV